MEIVINNRPKGAWGRIGVDEATTAASALSGDSFKIWVRLSLNQDGYAWHGELEPTVVEELVEHGYLFPLEDGGYVFNSAGDAVSEEWPVSWKRIVELYGSVDNQRDYEYVRDKLESAALSDKADNILSYWFEKFENLQKIDHSKTKNRLKYDLSVILAWWVQEHFRFEPGDVLEIGTGGSRLRYHDSAVEQTVRTGAVKRKLGTIKMTSGTVATWNRWLEDGLIEIPLRDIGDIMRSRRDRTSRGLE